MLLKFSLDKGDLLRVRNYVGLWQLLLHDLHHLLLLDAGIPLRYECLELGKLSIAFDKALRDYGLDTPNRFQGIVSHVLISNLTEDFIWQLLPLISGNMNEVTHEAAGTPLAIVIVLAWNSALVVDMNKLRQLRQSSLRSINNLF